MHARRTRRRYGPYCTVQGPPPNATAEPRETFVVSPTGTDSPACGGATSPCKTLRRALENHLWQALLAPADTPAASLTLMEGVFMGADNRNLVLHGPPLEIVSMHGPQTTIIDCASDDRPDTHDALGQHGEHGILFMTGESDAVTVRGLTIRKCLTEQQSMDALRNHREWAAHVVGPAKWPLGRKGVNWRQNIWLSH